jgi:hypothetical protein
MLSHADATELRTALANDMFFILLGAGGCV